jgi:hypothetical protein
MNIKDDTPRLPLTELVGAGELFGMVKTLRPSACPQCGAEVVKRIVYGLPAEVDPTPVEERDYALGGRRLRKDSPGWHCGACEHRW